MAKFRKQRLLDALSLYKLFSEADGVEQWIGEKERMLETIMPAEDIEDVEVMRHRYDGLQLITIGEAIGIWMEWMEFIEQSLPR